MADFHNRHADPYMAQALSNIAQLFAPPSPQSLASYSMANAKKQEADRLSNLYAVAQEAGIDQATFDRMGQAAGQWTPSTGYYGTNMTNRRQAITDLYRPLNPGQLSPAVPEELMGAIGLPGIAERKGAPENLSETQVKGRILQQQPEGDQRAAVMGDVPVETIIMDGKPVIVPRNRAWDQAPAPKQPGTVINMGADGQQFGEPPKGTVWQRDEAGKVKLDERGAPIAIPFQGGPVWAEEQNRDKKEGAAADRQNRQGGVVAQDIDRALSIIEANPLTTTGMGAQALSGIGGTNAKNVASLLDAVRANVGFDQLQAMRQSSPTGGALGAVSDSENKLLQSALGSLEQSQDQKQLTDNLKRVKNIYLDIVHGRGNGPARAKLSYASEWDTAPAAAPAQGTPAAPAAPGKPLRYNPATGQIE